MAQSRSPEKIAAGEIAAWQGSPTITSCHRNPDLRTTLPHFSIPAQDETMTLATLTSMRPVDVKDQTMDETKNLSETEDSQPLVEGPSSSSDETKDLSETKVPATA